MESFSSIKGNPQSQRYTFLPLSDKGFIIPLVVILLPALIFLVSLAVNTSYSALLRSEVQSATDASSLAGADLFNGQSTGWQFARIAAIETLNNSFVHFGLGTTKQLSEMISINPSDLEAGDSRERVEWQGDGISVGIRRGRWVHRAGSLVFESLEDSDAGGNWQNLNKGIPKLLVANAVQISVKMENIATILPAPGAWREYTLAKVGTAVKGPVDAANIAPFALSICSLVDDNEGTFVSTSNYSPSGVCFADRLFTKAGGYSDVPEFNYMPSAPSEGDSTLCNWGTPKFLNSTDNFGLVGLANSAPSSEGDVVNIIKNASGGTQSGIYVGDNFYVLSEGLTSTEADSAVWDRISANAEETPSFESGGNVTFASALNGVAPRTALSWYPTCPSDPLRTHGLCNSKRFAQTSTGSTCVAGYQFTCPASPGGCDDWPVWRVLVPVIASHGAASTCMGVDGSTEDYPIDPAAPQEIIGFVRMTIFDVDIDEPAPAYPPGCLPNPASAPGMPWGFSSGGAGTGFKCNLVRAIVDCDTSGLQTSANPSLSAPAVLVQ